MAQLAFAVVGGIIGGPIGWAIGAAVGQALFPGSLPDQAGPRIGDLRAQQSQYGAAIPIVYGTTRIAGQVIWSTPLLETATTRDAGGKGGPSQSQTAYSYRVSMAVMLCEGPVVGIRKIWADGKLIYNTSAAADFGTLLASFQKAAKGNALGAFVDYNYAFYPGSETQLPDPTMEAYLGVGNVPAHRGISYVVLSDFQLADFGNRRPNLTFEVIVGGTVGSSVTYSAMPPFASSSYVAAATDGETIVALNGGAPAGVTRSSDGGATWSPVLQLGPTFANGYDVAYGGGVWVATGGTKVWLSADALTWTQFDGPSVTLLNRVKWSGTRWAGVGISHFGWSYDAKTWFSVVAPVAGTWVDLCWTGSAFVALGGAGGSNIATSPDGVVWTLQAGIGFGSSWKKLAYNGSVMVAVRSGGAGGARSLDGGLTWASNSMPLNQWTGVEWDGERFVACANSAGIPGATSVDGDAWTVLAPQTEAYDSMVVVSGLSVFISRANTAPKSVLLRFSVPTSGAVTLSTVVSDFCTRAGLTAADIDTTALIDTVDGYSVGQRMAARIAIEPLQRAYSFDAIESDAKIVFRLRGSASVATIPADALAAALAGDSLPDDLTITRQQDVELPAVVSVVYIDRDSDYQQNTQQARRGTSLSTQQMAVEFAITMSANRARAIAETLMYDGWTQRSRYQFRTSRAYAALEPSDVVTIARNGATHTLRLQSKTESRSGVIQWDAVAEEASVFTQSVTGGAGADPQGALRVSPASVFVPLDLPMLRDADDGIAFYAAACGVADGWRGAVVYRSSDSGLTYDETGTVLSEATIGYTVGTLWSNTMHPNMFDQTSLINVTLRNGTLSSAAELSVLEGANYIAVGSEVIQFKTATLYAQDTYQLSGLLRGRRGTEWAMAGHAASGEQVVLLNTATLQRFATELSAARLYKPVSVGRTVQATNAQSFTYAGVNLLPFAPVQMGAGRNASNDITLTWFRRSRQGISLPWNYDPPLAETALLYDVEIWNSGFGTLRRTFSNLTAETVSYTAAQQAADSGGVLTSYGVRVYQRNAVIGRGYVLQGVV